MAKDFGEIVDPAAASTSTASAENSSKKQEMTESGKEQLEEKLEKPAGLIMSNLANEAVTASGGDCGCGSKK